MHFWRLLKKKIKKRGWRRTLRWWYNFLCKILGAGSRFSPRALYQPNQDLPPSPTTWQKPPYSRTKTTSLNKNHADWMFHSVFINVATSFIVCAFFCWAEHREAFFVKCNVVKRFLLKMVGTKCWRGWRNGWKQARLRTNMTAVTAWGEALDHFFYL